MTPPLPSATLLSSPEQTPVGRALQRKLQGPPTANAHAWGPLAALAQRIGVVQQSQRPRLLQPQLLVLAADHGLAVDLYPDAPSSPAPVLDLLEDRRPLPALAHQMGMAVTIVDAGLAQTLPRSPGVLTRKIAHGTRHARIGPAMSADQLQAAVRAGMEIANRLPGNVVALTACGTGADESAALLLSRLSPLPLTHWTSDLGRDPTHQRNAHGLLEAASERHAELSDPADLAAALGGYELAMMVGILLGAARRRHVVLVDGLTACAAVLVASHIAGPVSEFCIFCRSRALRALDPLLSQMNVTETMNLGLDAEDGTAALLTWPLLQSAVGLLSALPDVPCTFPDTEPQPSDDD